MYTTKTVLMAPFLLINVLIVLILVATFQMARANSIYINVFEFVFRGSCLLQNYENKLE